MVEITATEQNKEKRMKRKEDSIRDLWDKFNTPTFELWGPRRRREKERVWENI